MPNFGMAEQYGIDCNDISSSAIEQRQKHRCPFVKDKCNKSGGVCSLTDGSTYSITCPRRFREDDLLFNEISKVAFGSPENCVAIGEVGFLDPVNDSAQSVGNIDNIIVKLENDAISNWCALEIQAVYFSGAGMGKEIKQFETEHKLPHAGSRRPDFRSSATKRLLPQLEIKIPTLRRWGKKMFVAVDEPFFSWMPEFRKANHISNADICWCVFTLNTSISPYKLEFSRIVFATLEDSREGMVAGSSPPMPDYEQRILKKISSGILWKAN